MNGSKTGLYCTTKLDSFVEHMYFLTSDSLANGSSNWIHHARENTGYEDWAVRRSTLRGFMQSIGRCGSLRMIYNMKITVKGGEDRRVC